MGRYLRDLLPWFEALSLREYGDDYDFPDDFNERAYQGIVTALSSVRCSKVHCLIQKPGDLFTYPSAALLLADAVILSGCIDFDDAVGNESAWPSEGHSMSMIYDPRLIANAGIPDPGSVNRAAIVLTSFGTKILNQWAKEASPFIESGRLVYLPQRLVCTMLGGELSRSELAIHPSWSTWCSAKVTTAEHGTLLPEAPSFRGIDMYSRVIVEFAAPILDGLPLGTLYRVMQDEGDALIRFRKALRQFLDQYADALVSPSQQVISNSRTIQVRQDILEPEIAELNQRFKRITQSRAIRIAGATISSVGLVATAVLASGLTAAIAAATGAGGATLLAKEYSDYRSELLGLKDNPWYFAWKLKRAQLKFS